MWQRSSLNFKLRFSFGIIAFILFIVGSLNIFFLNKTVDTFHHVSEINLGNAITLGSMDTATNIIQRSLLQMGMSNDEKTIAEMEERIKFFYQEFDRHQKHYEGIPFVPGEDELYTELKTSWDELKVELLKLQVLAKDPSEEAIKNFSAAFNTGIKTKRERFYTAIEKLIAFQNNEGKTWLDLATMSGNAAQDISNMLGDSTAKVQEIVRQTKEEMSRLTTQSKNDVENGIKVANEAALASKNLSQQAMSLNTISQ
ncbi:MAG: MCP four helix bundle domain-containing protein, partial [Bacteriovoracaceae bacterium]|nr:MCP four helix bundle domain-containing protein [Bacteriovoracaceae bacterium]